MFIPFQVSSLPFQPGAIRSGQPEAAKRQISSGPKRGLSLELSSQEPTPWL